MADIVLEDIFKTYIQQKQDEAVLLKSIAEKLEKIESIGGGGGSASIEDYESGKNYKRNVLVVDTSTETVYRVIQEYTSDTVENDAAGGYLKLVGFESQVVTFDHLPTQEELDALPEDVLVAIYSKTSKPYEPILSSDG